MDIVLAFVCRTMHAHLVDQMNSPSDRLWRVIQLDFLSFISFCIKLVSSEDKAQLTLLAKLGIPATFHHLLKQFIQSPPTTVSFPDMHPIQSLFTAFGQCQYFNLPELTALYYLEARKEDQFRSEQWKTSVLHYIMGIRQLDAKVSTEMQRIFIDVLKRFADAIDYAEQDIAVSYMRFIVHCLKITQSTPVSLLSDFNSQSGVDILVSFASILQMETPEVVKQCYTDTLSQLLSVGNESRMTEIDDCGLDSDFVFPPFNSDASFLSNKAMLKSYQDIFSHAYYTLPTSRPTYDPLRSVDQEAYADTKKRLLESLLTRFQTQPMDFLIAYNAGLFQSFYQNLTTHEEVVQRAYLSVLAFSMIQLHFVPLKVRVYLFLLHKCSHVPK